MLNPTKPDLVGIVQTKTDAHSLTKDTQNNTNAQENKPLLQTVCNYAPVNCTGNCEKCTHLLDMNIIDLNTKEVIA
jgi:hypothetical protein